MFTRIEPSINPTNNTMEVKKVDAADITHEQFYEEHWKAGVPLVFKNATKLWGAYNTFSPDWFRANYGDRLTEVEGKSYTMNEIMDLVEGKDTSRPVPYPCKYHIPSQLPELVSMVKPLNLGFAKPNWLESSWFKRGYWGSALEIFIGGPGGKFPYVPKDYYHLSAWINQLYGHKQFTVWPMGQEEYLYPEEGNEWKSAIPDIENVDLSIYPLYANATPITFVVGPGETLFIPFGMWHTAKSLEPTISVAFDLLNERNFPKFVKDVWGFKSRESKLKGVVATGYAAVGGMVCRIGDAMGVERVSGHL
ncbi:MAG: cupin-like domain-containing protein [Flavobacteriales bacterium]|nr:cupin-like domain-containing protein [Flavobacteriales bacterium]